MNDLQMIELSIQEAEKNVEKAKRLQKLLSNRDFKEVILDGYFEKEAARLASALGDPTLAAHRSEIISSIDGIGRLQAYFRTVEQIGKMSTQAITEGREALDEIRANGGDV